MLDLLRTNLSGTGRGNRGVGTTVSRGLLVRDQYSQEALTGIEEAEYGFSSRESIWVQVRRVLYSCSKPSMCALIVIDKDPCGSPLQGDSPPGLFPVLSS